MGGVFPGHRGVVLWASTAAKSRAPPPPLAGIGDAIALIGAASYSLYIFRIGVFAKKGLPGNLTQAWKTVILSCCTSGGRRRIAASSFPRASPRRGPGGRTRGLVRADLHRGRPGVLRGRVPGEGPGIRRRVGVAGAVKGEPLAAVMGATALGESLGTFGYVGGAGLVAAIPAGPTRGGYGRKAT